MPAPAHTEAIQADRATANVLFAGDRLQVRRVDAAPMTTRLTTRAVSLLVMAQVVHVVPDRDRADVIRVGYAVRVVLLVVSYVDTAVPVADESSSPQPATMFAVGLVHVVSEASVDRGEPELGLHRSRPLVAGVMRAAPTGLLVLCGTRAPIH